MSAVIRKIYNFLFSTNGRMSQKNYCLLSICGFLVILILFLFLLSAPNNSIFIKIKIVVMFFILPLYCILYSIFSKVATIKRLHDLGKSGEEIWKLNIPIKNITLGASLLFEKGQMQDNEYGPTTWTKKEIDKVKPSDLKRKLNNLAVKKFKTHKHQKNQKKKRTI